MAAGGGGKGMRTCYNDEEVREAYPLAKAEAKKFFVSFTSIWRLFNGGWYLIFTFLLFRLMTGC